ncbi:hypothetical protein KKH23_05685, partial [Patescibacteria group bacterium]|nr:hypothetical protein [Patescibacteria group bacterium]
MRELAAIEAIAKERGWNLPTPTKLIEQNVQAVSKPYADKPVEFCRELLGLTLTEDVQRLMESVRDNRVTVAKSANSTGKTHGAAHTALWWLRTRMESQVYTTAAPPYANLKNLLWAEIDHAVEINSWLFSDLKHTTLRIERHPKSFLVGVAIPQSGTEQQRESKFCAGADDLFEMTDGSVVTYKSLVGRKVNAVSVDPEFNKVEAEAEFFDNGIEEVYEIILSSGEKVLRTGKHPLFRGEIAQSRKTMGGTHVSGRSLV